MLRNRDLYVQSVTTPLNDGNNNRFGTLRARYEVHQLIDVSNCGHKTVYDIECTLRVSIPNSSPITLQPSAPCICYVNYPAAVTCDAVLTAADGESALDPSFVPHLSEYEPRTLNTAVSTSTTSGFGTQLTNTVQRTTGSSINQTNSFGSSVSLTVSPWDVSLSGTVDFNASVSEEQSQSRMSGSDSSRNQQRDTGSQINVKDWCSYASVDYVGVKPSWVWAQEYPWNVLQYNASGYQAVVTQGAFLPGYAWPDDPDKDDDAATPLAYSSSTVALPQFVVARLVGQDESIPSGTATFVTPPSELSLFGIDFVMKCRWQVELPHDPNLQSLTVVHALNYALASHGMFPMSGGTVTPTIRQYPSSSTDSSVSSSDSGPSPAGSVVPGPPLPPPPAPPTPSASASVAFAAALKTLTDAVPASSGPLDLVLLGLDPIRHGGTSNGAAIGFASNDRYVYWQAAAAASGTSPAVPGAFKFISEANNLVVTGTGFDQIDPLQSSFVNGSSAAASLTIQFKVIDTTTEYSLYLKHWVTHEAGVLLSIEVNPTTRHHRGVNKPIIRSVTSKEGGASGDNNLLEIALRNKNFASPDYHDFLDLGVNTIQITLFQVSAEAPKKNATYCLQAIAIGTP